MNNSNNKNKLFSRSSLQREANTIFFFAIHSSLLFSSVHIFLSLFFVLLFFSSFGFTSPSPIAREESSFKPKKRMPGAGTPATTSLDPDISRVSSSSLLRLLLRFSPYLVFSSYFLLLSRCKPCNLRSLLARKPSLFHPVRIPRRSYPWGRFLHPLVRPAYFCRLPNKHTFLFFFHHFFHFILFFSRSF